MNSPDNTDNQVVNGAQIAMVALATQQGLDIAGEATFMSTMPNGDPDHVMLWGDEA